MKKRFYITVGLLIMAFTSGCQSISNNSETKALRQQEDDSQQQLANLQQEIQNNSTSNTIEDLNSKVNTFLV